MENSLGERIEYGYDAAGNRTANTVKDASLTITRQATAQFDDLGRLLKSMGAYVGEAGVRGTYVDGPCEARVNRAIA